MFKDYMHKVLKHALAILVIISPQMSPQIVMATESVDYVVITHPSTKNTTVTISKLQGIYGLKIKSWDDDTPITIYSTNPLDKEYQQFCKMILGIFAHQLQRAWDRLTYSGRAKSPTIVASFEEMIDLVSKTPGAIGYIPQDAVNSAVFQVEIIRGNGDES